MFNYRFDVIYIPQKVYLDWFWEGIYTLYTPPRCYATGTDSAHAKCDREIAGSTLGLPVHYRVAYVNSAFHPSGVGKSNTSLLAGVKAGRVHVCRVADKTVWSHMAGDVP